MSAPLSIIIPTLNAEKGLVKTLEALMEGLGAGLIREVIVVDGGSTDKTLDIADEAGCRVLHCKPSRGGQLRDGAEAARGDWFLFLHADTVLKPGWADAFEDHFPTGKAGYGKLRFDRTHLRARLTAGWANLRSAVFGLPYGDQGLLIPRKLYDAVGGYPDQLLMEDVALVRALGADVISMPVVAVTSAAKYEQSGWIRRGWRNLRTLVLYYFGAEPDRLAAFYRR